MMSPKNILAYCEEAGLFLESERVIDWQKLYAEHGIVQSDEKIWKVYLEKEHQCPEQPSGEISIYCSPLTRHECYGDLSPSKKNTLERKERNRDLFLNLATQRYGTHPKLYSEVAPVILVFHRMLERHFLDELDFFVSQGVNVCELFPDYFEKVEYGSDTLAFDEKLFDYGVISLAHQREQIQMCLLSKLLHLTFEQAQKCLTSDRYNKHKSICLFDTDVLENLQERFGWETTMGEAFTYSFSNALFNMYANTVYDLSHSGWNRFFPSRVHPEIFSISKIVALFSQSVTQYYTDVEEKSHDELVVHVAQKMLEKPSLHEEIENCLNHGINMHYFFYLLFDPQRDIEKRQSSWAVQKRFMVAMIREMMSR